MRRFRWPNPRNFSSLISRLSELFTSRAEEWPEGTQAQIKAFQIMARELPSADGVDDQGWRTKQTRNYNAGAQFFEGKHSNVFCTWKNHE